MQLVHLLWLACEMQYCVHVNVAFGSSDLLDWGLNPVHGKCVWRNPHRCLSATVVLCEIRLSCAYLFICRLLPSSWARGCVCLDGILLLSDWVFWAENPYHLVVHGMCCTRLGISVKSPRGRWGTMGEIFVTLDIFILIDHCVTLS